MKKKFKADQEGIHTILFTNSKAIVLLDQGVKSSEFWKKTIY